ncbi:hypothetical protein ACIO8G_03610 [Streptomyces sp. NPDC087219]|uniref:hypothetical protein n=1 Tax=unclassified Streptomyces TaxID=2593676 RepID=UPI00382B0E21
MTVESPWTPAAEDDPLDGLRAALTAAPCGYEPESGYPDACWILHPVHDEGVRLRWDQVLAREGRRLADWPGTLSHLVFEGVTGGGRPGRARSGGAGPHHPRPARRAPGEERALGARHSVRCRPGPRDEPSG